MALNSMPNNKAPGDDGLTVLLYKKFWKELSKPLLDCLRENIIKGEMTTSQKRSVIRLIQKKGKDPTLVKNWRPISLLNIDSKIFSKCIAERIRLPMKYLIHEDQKAFIKGRLMAENIIELQTTLQKLELENTKAAVLNIDFQKAFDTIDHEALWKTMEAFGYGKNLIHLCKTLYKGATSCTINNGYTSQRFEVGRSCRQGDCVSPYLFLLIIEPLLSKLRLTLPKLRTSIGQARTVFAYADDCNLIVVSNRQVSIILGVLEEFGEFSGLRINKDKSDILCLRTWNRNGDNIQGIKITDNITVTGTRISASAECDNEFNLNTALDKIQSTIESLSGRNLSLAGKSLIINSKIFGMLMHHFRHNILTPPQIKRINRMIFKFIWNGPDKVKREIIRKKFKHGGLNIMEPHNVNNAALMAWLQKPPLEGEGTEDTDLWKKELKKHFN